MNLTESEAQAKWCPFTRVAFLGSHVGNRPSSAMLRFADSEATRTGDVRDLQYVTEQRDDTMCIGQRCMAWRWNYQAMPNRGYWRCSNSPHAIEEPARPTDVPIDWVWQPYDTAEGTYARWIESDAAWEKRRLGFCGLAGTP